MAVRLSVNPLCHCKKTIAKNKNEAVFEDRFVFIFDCLFRKWIGSIETAFHRRGFLLGKTIFFV